MTTNPLAWARIEDESGREVWALGRVIASSVTAIRAVVIHIKPSTKNGTSWSWYVLDIDGLQVRSGFAFTRAEAQSAAVVARRELGLLLGAAA